MKLRYRIWIKRAEKRIQKLMPGKTLEDVSKMYEQFYGEFKVLRDSRDNNYEEILDCLDRYRDVLEIADMFPEEGTESWASYRSAVKFMIEHEDF